MKTIITAWFVAIGLILYRDTFLRTDASGKRVIVPPQPKEVVVTVGFFGLLVLLVEAAPESQNAISILAWGVDLAAVIAMVSGKAPPPAKGGAWPPGTLAPEYILPNGNPDYNVGGKNDNKASSSPSGPIGGILGGLSKVPSAVGVIGKLF